MAGLLLNRFTLVDDLLENADGIILYQNFVHLLGERRIRNENLYLLFEGFHSGRLKEQLMQTLQDVLGSDPGMQITIQAQIGQQLNDAFGGALILLLQEDVSQ